LADISLDVVNDLLRQQRFRPREVWRLVKDRSEDRKEAFLIVGDSVPATRYSRFIELVRAPYRGTEHRGVRGSGVVSLVPSGGKDREFSPIDSRGYAPEVEGKTKNDHRQERFVHASDQKQITARTIVCEAGSASAETLKLIPRRKGPVFTTLKSKRVGRLSKEQGSSQLEALAWTPDRLSPGGRVKLKAGPCKGRLFTLVAPDGASAWVITNDLGETGTAQVAEAFGAVRWQGEELHRGLKQLRGSEKCQCRAARAQRTHLACCYHAGVSLKVKAKELGQTLDELRSSLFSYYLRAELRNPRIGAC
jgi:hypothetical protein